jgi:hypothetical protein
MFTAGAAKVETPMLASPSLDGWRGYSIFRVTLPKDDKIDDPCHRLKLEIASVIQASG